LFSIFENKSKPIIPGLINPYFSLKESDVKSHYEWIVFYYDEVKIKIVSSSSIVHEWKKKKSQTNFLFLDKQKMTKKKTRYTLWVFISCANLHMLIRSSN
jgi:hypothetical protein